MDQREGGDIYIENFLQDQQDSPSSSLQEVFRDSCVLLTGATGALGSVVLEKLLRSCPGIVKIYVTIRGKKSKPATQRLKELLSTKLFDVVKLSNRESLNKVELLDLDLGLESHVATVTSSVSLVIHCALVVDWRHSIKEAVEANLKQTKALLQLAYACVKLEAFVLVSSTICHNEERVVLERFYLPKISSKVMTALYESLSDHTFNDSGNFFSKLMDSFQVSESFASYVTLVLAEQLVLQGRRSLPIAVVRPSMLVGSYKDPLAGWLTSKPPGLMGLLNQAMRGRLCSLRSDTTLKAELMPTDLSASLVCAVTAQTALTRRNWQNKEVLDFESHESFILDNDIPIFNLVSSNHSPVTWKEFFNCSLRHARCVPFFDTAWYPHLFLTQSKIWFSLWFFILHLLPAWAIDSLHVLLDENPNILNAKQSRVYQKYLSLRESCEALSLHTLKSQQYSDSNTRTLWHSLSPSDRSTFNFHPAQLDWDEYLHTLARGARLYSLGDTPDTIPRAVKRMQRQKLLHYGFLVMSSFLIMLTVRGVLKLCLF